MNGSQSILEQKGRLKYFTCKHSDSLPKFSDDIEYVRNKLQTLSPYEEPFKWVLHICDFFPKDLYEGLERAWKIASYHEDKYMPFVEGRPSCIPPKKCKISLSGLNCIFGLKLSEWLNKTAELQTTFPHLAELDEVNRALQRAWKILSSREIQGMFLKKLQILDHAEKDPDISFKAVLPRHRENVLFRRYVNHPYLTHTDSPLTLATIIIPFPVSVEQKYTHGIRFLRYAGWERNSEGFLKDLAFPLGHQKGGSTHAHSFERNSAIAFRTVPSTIGGTSKQVTDDIKRKVINGISGIRHYKKRNVNFPSWHSAPAIGYDSTCNSFEPRRFIFLRWASSGNVWK